MTDDNSMHAALDLDSILFRWLEQMKTDLRSRWGEIHELRGPFGVHGVRYDVDGDEPFATIGFCLPDGVYAETECDTYGQLEGFRIYRNDEDD